MEKDFSLITIQGLRVFAHHGVYSEETEKGQNFVVNAELEVNIEQAGRRDSLEMTVNYGNVCKFISTWMQENTFQLLEAVAEQLCQAILLEFPLIEGLTLEVCKPEAPLPVPVDDVSVKIHRAWHNVYLSLGSNMGDPETNLNRAIDLLNSQKHSHIVQQSTYLKTKPYGGVKQDDFLNCIVLLRTMLSPNSLLDFIHIIEQSQHRSREVHWGPRTLDIDIIFYDDLIYYDEKLCIPHADLHKRYFVLKPMSEIAPFFRHPVFGFTVEQMLGALSRDR